MLDPKQITDDLRGQFRGRLHFDRLTRGLYSTDASPFQIEPLAVAVPEDPESLATLVRYCHDHTIAAVPRGAGTGLAGESLGPAVVLDLSVHFRRVLAIGADTVTVQPGVVLNDLNAELAKIGRRFAPDPASGATCTVGGVVATNASGGNAFHHGYTRDYVAGLGVIWDSGEAGQVGSGERPAPLPEGRGEKDEEPTPNPSLKGGERSDSPFPSGTGVGSSRTDTISQEVTALLTRHSERIAVSRTRTPFDRCGYQLHGVLTAAGVNLAKLLVGSEGTLAITTEIVLRTVPLAGGTCLTLLGFPTLDAAVRAGLALRQFGPVACDLLDRRLLSVTRNVGLPTVGAALVVAFEADTEREAKERAWGAVEALRREHILRVLAEPTCEPDGSAHIRGVRDAAVSGLYGSGGQRPVAFIEDVGVPADVLPDFLTRVQDVLKRFEVSGTFLVHALTGQVHTRPLLDLNDPTDRAKLWPIAEAVHGLALALGGTVSTQHGTGIARTPWVDQQCGPLVPVFRELKRIFDPKGILNPGKIVGPDPSREAWPLRTEVRGQRSEDGEQNPGSGTNGSAPAEQSPELRAPTPLLMWPSPPIAEAGRCNGCGDCRTRTPSARMCPTFRATGNEAATPRAMANMLRLLTAPDTATPEEVRAVAEWCVNCKMCRDECDAKIDIPKLMLETKAKHHADHGLDRGEWTLARAEWLASVGSNFAPLVNGLLARKSVRWLTEKLFGISRHRQLPAFALRNFFRRARGAGLTKKRTPRTEDYKRDRPDPLSEFRISPSAHRTPKVALFVDVFAAYSDPLIGTAAVAVLQHNGIEVYVPPRQVGSGVSAYARGDLDTAREFALRNVRVFADLAREGYRIVSLEPTAALMLAQDYLDILDDPDTAAVAANTVELSTYLGELHAAKRLRTDFRRLDVTLGHHIPCHLKALRGPIQSPGLLALVPGVRVHTIDAGCSGMAGTWGLKAENYATSMAAGAGMFAELNRPRVLFGSTECSACRLQMQEGSGKRTLHPVQYLAYAYGLLPELEPRFHRPLGGLVSD
ncbi:FAD-binding oxidoreductase [Frigoriglobus tundricola]|uniref:Anaerobic glycerol-3-phosphate dehydrogenase subunit C n=1 Tax=Frigoriglobus tundricola TaxID=2774151 RepID=A0A6M5YQ20_9BACT|nr:FAD-binding oxidoreductase [Frigoriglobus tundricola]QJW96139.1 Anaerobic glycerol-3-phosphate dehydrogenase subunit C [Frigoriglobus tundricola]